jgi:superfamily II DNA or RNA helicase
VGNGRISIDSIFDDNDALLLHQLRLREWMASAGRKRFGEESQPAVLQTLVVLPELWKLTSGVEPWNWQHECVAKWREKDGHGTVKVVTGGGKTLLALLMAELTQNTDDKDLHLAVVVPTIVLMHQWYDAILEHGNLPPQAIGRLGGGYDEDFSGGRRILISVLASASERLPRLVKDANIGDHLMLVADECHRAGASEMSKVLKTRCRWSLGLSATPEREDDQDGDYNESLLGKKLGPIVYEFNLADAVHVGLVPKFTIKHYGLSMTLTERQRYEALSRSISDAMSQLKALRDPRSDGDFFSWARTVASRNQGDTGVLASRFVSDVSKRRELLNRLDKRSRAVVKLIEHELKCNPDARVILFHESITEVMDLFARLCSLGFKVIAEHSELPSTYREIGLDHFRKGVAQIIVSARSLIEGFNVPAADIGIIVASSGSVRQRIQSLGRVLRRHRGLDGEEKTSCIHVLYAADSVEENIYAKIDWYEVTGLETNEFYLWDAETEPLRQDGPPRKPLPREEDISSDSLEPGGKYPGQYEGIELSCDSQRNITNSAGQYAAESAELADALLRIKGSGGRFRVTPKRQFVLVRVPSDEDWETLFVTQLSKPLRFGVPARKAKSNQEIVDWVCSAQTGDPYPFAGVPIVEESLRFKKRAGGVISKKVRGGEVFAREGDKAEDPDKGSDANRLLAAVKQLQRAGKRVSRIEINEARHALHREGGQLLFLCALERGLEFPPDQPEQDQHGDHDRI